MPAVSATANGQQDVIVVGGGLAGLTAAIHLARAGACVTVVESKGYPQHKVCGEYVSNEIVPYFEELGIPVRSWQPRQVERFRLHAPSGRWVESRLPLGGFGLRRFTLDRNLYELGQELGVRFLLNSTVSDVSLAGDRFRVDVKDHGPLGARAVIGSFGKRSVLDKRLQRPFAQRAASHVAAKFYVRADFPDDLVALFTFEGGYAGAVRVEDGTVDIAYLATDRLVRDHEGLAGLERDVLGRNPALRRLLTSERLGQDHSLAISNISFDRKEQVAEHMLLVGDAAGMILPLCGNGMAMGVHGAKLAAEATLEHLRGHLDRTAMEQRFRDAWRSRFSSRIAWGRRLQPFVEKPALSELAVRALRLVPGLLHALIRRTHGQPFA